MKKAREEAKVVEQNIMAMKREKIADQVSTIVPGSKVTVRFGRNAEPADLSYLMGMFHSGGITLAESQLMIFSAISGSRAWGSAQNRVVSFGVTSRFDQGWFKDRIMRRIDYINVE